MKLAICTPAKPGYSETFIQAHLDRLKPSFVYDGGIIPLYLNGKPLGSKFSRGLLRVIAFIKKDELWHDKYLFKRRLKRDKPDVLLAEYGTTGAEIYSICKSLKIPLVVHFHGFDASQKSTIDKYKIAYQEMFDYSSSIIAVSQEMKKDLIELSCPEEKIQLATYGPDDCFFDVEPDYSSKQLISIGRFVDKKAPYFLILAMKELVKEHSDVKLVMVGDGPLFNTCFNLIEYFELHHNIQLIGKKTREEILSLMKDSSVFVQHSIQALNGDKEGSPVAIIEAAAAGLPVVSTLHAGIPETVVHGETGYLVEEHDVKSFTKHLITLMDSEKSRANFGKASSEFILSTFSMNKHIDLLISKLEQAKR